MKQPSKVRIRDSKGADGGRYGLIYNFQHSQTLFHHDGFLLMIPVLQCRCHPTCTRFKWRPHKPLDWWIPIAPSGSRQLGRPRCNLAAERDHWGGSDAGRQATSRVIWGSKRDVAPTPSRRGGRTHALSINCGVDHLSQCVCEPQYLCTCAEGIRDHKPERVFEVWFETGDAEAAPLSACPSIPTAQSRWSCRGRVLR